MSYYPFRKLLGILIYQLDLKAKRAIAVSVVVYDPSLTFVIL